MLAAADRAGATGCQQSATGGSVWDDTWSGVECRWQHVDNFYWASTAGASTAAD